MLFTSISRSIPMPAIAGDYAAAHEQAKEAGLKLPKH
jgi:hypothetical protein